MAKQITDREMANFWTREVRRLEAMRPMTADEAMAGAEQCEREAAELEQAVRDAEGCPRETGRVARGDSVAARDSRNAQALGDARRAVWGFSTRALQARGKAEALRKIASQPVGQALEESLAEARQRAKYYSDLAARSEGVTV